MTVYKICSNCSAPLSKMAARAINRKSIKQPLLLNHWTDFEIISQECSLGYPLPKLLKPICSVEQNRYQGYKWKKALNDFFCLIGGQILI